MIHKFKNTEKDWKEKETKQWEEQIDKLTEEIKNIWNNLLNHETESQFNYIVDYGLRLDEFYIYKSEDYTNRILYKVKKDYGDYNYKDYCNITYYPTEKIKMKIDFVRISEEAERALDDLKEIDFQPSIEKKYENVKTFYEFSKKLKDKIGDKIDNPVYDKTETYEVDGENIIYKDLLFYTSDSIAHKWDEMLSYTDPYEVLSFSDIIDGKLYDRFVDLLGKEVFFDKYRIINVDKEDALVYKIINLKEENLLFFYYDKNIETGNGDGFLVFFKTDNPDIRIELLELTDKIYEDFVKKSKEVGRKEKEGLKAKKIDYDKSIKRMSILYDYEEATKNERTLEF